MAVKSITYSGYISSWEVAASDRKHIIKHEGRHSNEILPEDIVAIRHGGRELYRAA